MAKLYTYVAPQATTSVQLPKQEAIVLKALRQLGKGSPEQIAEVCIDMGLETRQDPVRIVEYYASDLKKRGLLNAMGEKRGAKRVVVLLEGETE